MSGYSLTLPDFERSDLFQFSSFLKKNLFDCSALHSLETTKRLNWWTNGGFCRKLWPLATAGDGNCLLHAASLAMWGFHDRNLTLRRALYAGLSSGEHKDALWRRWRFQQTRLSQQVGLVYSEMEWMREWDEIVAMASLEPRQTKNESANENVTYENLEGIHILALANILHHNRYRRYGTIKCEW